MGMPKFVFSTDSYPTEFTVVSFRGTEEISRLFKYEIEVKVHHDTQIDESDIFDDGCTFKFEKSGDSDDDDCELEVQGILSSFNYLRHAKDHDYYMATLVPKIWIQGLGCDYALYKRKSPEDILKLKIDHNGLTDDVDLDGIVGVSATAARHFVCQYKESNLNFISRLAEQYGIYYYFDHSADKNSSMIFADDSAYDECESPDLQFESSASGDKFYKTVSHFTAINNKISRHVNVRDINPWSANPVIASEASYQGASGPAEGATGTRINLVNENLADQDSDLDTDDSNTDTDQNEGNDSVDIDAIADEIAQIRLDAITCKRTVYEMHSGAFQLSPGFTFNLDGHPRSKFNKEYLVISVVHEGNALDAVHGAHHNEHRHHDDDDDHRKKKPYYRNIVKAIDADVQFRPELITPVPVATTTTGYVYTESNWATDPNNTSQRSDVAERDHWGRYRVKFKFIEDTDSDDAGSDDTSDPDVDKFSYWLRMAQSAAGRDDTLDIPLKGGVEVQIGFEDGSPDKPYIMSALPDRRFQSFVNKKNPTNGFLYTSGLLGLGAKGGTFRYQCATEIDANDPQYVSFVPQSSQYLRNPKSDSNDGNDQLFNVVKRRVGTDKADPTDPDNDPGIYMDTNLFTADDDLTTDPQTHELGGYVHIYRSYGDTYRWINGNTYQWDNEKYFSFGNDYEEVHEDQDPDSVNQETFDMTQYMTQYKPKGRRHDPNYSYSDWQDGQDGLVEKNWGDKCEYHFGKAFNWSGGLGPGGSLQEYNYGNGYTENLINSMSGTIADISGATNYDMYKRSSQTPALASLSSVLATNPYSPQDYTAYFDTDTAGSNHPTAYELTDGNTYEYHHGFSLEVHDGDSHGWTHGDTCEWVNGNSTEWVNGDSRSDVLGSATDLLAGNSNSVVGGETNDVFVGAKTETTVAGALEINVSATVILGAVAEKEAVAQKQSASEKKQEAALKWLTANLESTEETLKKMTNALEFEVKSAAIVLDAFAINLKAPIINHTAALTKIG